jgi:Mycotoxin biosynthesis protein UstYa
MCSMDIGVFGSVWVQNKAQGLHTFVDFNTQHTCRDFEAIRSWAEKHQLSEHAPKDLLQAPKPGDGTKIWNGAP